MENLRRNEKRDLTCRAPSASSMFLSLSLALPHLTQQVFSAGFRSSFSQQVLRVVCSKFRVFVSQQLSRFVLQGFRLRFVLQQYHRRTLPRMSRIPQDSIQESPDSSRSLRRISILCKISPECLLLLKVPISCKTYFDVIHSLSKTHYIRSQVFQHDRVRELAASKRNQASFTCH
jgi:hypothetical protein